MPKDIDLTNKCGSCCHFNPIEDKATGECLQNPYDDSVVHDPKHPYWIVQRSRIKCKLYNAKPQTNADRIRSMSDEELAKMLTVGKEAFDCYECWKAEDEQCDMNCEERCLQWLQQPAE